MHACMYVCMYVCMYIRMYACMHVCMYFMYMYIVDMCVCVHICIYTAAHLRRPPIRDHPRQQLRNYAAILAPPPPCHADSPSTLGAYSRKQLCGKKMSDVFVARALDG